MKLIETQTVTTATPSVEFLSLPQTFTDLLLVVTGRSTQSTGQWTFVKIRPNGLTTNLTERALYGAGSGSVQSDANTSPNVFVNSNNTTANTFSSCSVYFSNYTSTSPRSFSSESVTENNDTTALIWAGGGLWNDSAVMNNLTLTVDGHNWGIGSVLSLYGITKGSDGIVTTTP